MNITLEVYTLYDNKVQSYGRPILFRDVHEAKNDLAGALKATERSDFNPTNYDLFHIGKFDTTTGKIETIAPAHICNIRSLAPKPEPEKETA